MRGVLLISGGIDSPVAGYLVGRQGLDLVMVHFDNRPFTNDDEVEKALRLMRKTDEALGRRSPRLIVPHGGIQDKLASTCRRNLGCVLCRRMMFRVAERLASRYEASCIVTGESLGQVASQTLPNIYVEEAATSMPILRPLIGFDKVEIERIAKKIGTYEVSISPGLCCTVAPKKPSTNSRLESVAEEESKVDVDRLSETEAAGAWEVE